MGIVLSRKRIFLLAVLENWTLILGEVGFCLYTSVMPVRLWEAVGTVWRWILFGELTVAVVLAIWGSYVFQMNHRQKILDILNEDP